MYKIKYLDQLCLFVSTHQTTVKYLDYGPFSSHLPRYDSSNANITKAESDLLYSTYGSDTGIQYAKRFVRRSPTPDPRADLARSGNLLRPAKRAFNRCSSMHAAWRTSWRTPGKNRFAWSTPSSTR